MLERDAKLSTNYLHLLKLPYFVNIMIHYNVEGDTTPVILKINFQYIEDDKNKRKKSYKN